MASNLIFPLLVIILIVIDATACSVRRHITYCTHSDSKVVHEFVAVDFNWPNAKARQKAIDNENFIVSNNIISGLDVYKKDVYVTVPRIRRGVPSTLNKVIKQNGRSILQPFPSWNMQRIGDCRALQNVAGIEIDPNNGWMWITDIGRINFFAIDGTKSQNICPAKIIVYNIETMAEVSRYEFPDNVAGRRTNFLNDLVIQYKQKIPRYAYISDTLGNRLVVYDRVLNSSHFLSHPSMLPEPGNGNITLLGETVEIPIGINGIALSKDGESLYFSPLAGYSLYQVPTRVTQNSSGDFAASVRKVGDKNSQGDGMVYSKNNKLYMSNFQNNAIDIWDIGCDRALQKQKFKNVNMSSIRTFKDSRYMNFVDSLTLDQYGSLWFTVNNLHKYVLGTMDFSGRSGLNMLIMKTYVGTTGYLDRRHPKRKYLRKYRTKTSCRVFKYRIPRFQLACNLFPRKLQYTP